MQRKNIILLTLIITSFLISLIIFFINDKRYTKLTFKYNYELNDEIVKEDRYVILKGTTEEHAIIVLDELFLGPMSVFNKKLVPYNLKYNKFFIRDKIAYLDISVDIIRYITENNIDIDNVLNLIEENLIDNIKKINSVIITIDGNLLGAGPAKNLLPQGD